MHIAEAKRRFKGLTIPWLCDNLANELKKRLGGLNNSEFIINPEGKVVKLRDWSSPQQLRADLEEFVGPLENVTNENSLGISLSPLRPIATNGIVPRIKKPERLQAVISKAIEKKGTQPFYAKLRAEADDSLLQDGDGTLYLGFQLDPLYHVHWNNLAAPIEYEITAVDPSVAFTPAKGKGPKVDEESDIDPREFLVKIEGADTSKALHLDVKYFACHDGEGWCKSIAQSYEILLDRDPHAGAPRDRGRRQNTNRRPQPSRFMPLVGALDTDDDGEISADELDGAPSALRKLDRDGNGVLSFDEFGPRRFNR